MALPFPFVASVKNQAGEVLGTMPVAIWPAARGSVTATGMAYDHEGEAPIGTFQMLDSGNTRIVVDGTEYMLIDRERQPFFPHVTLILRRVTARG